MKIKTKLSISFGLMVAVILIIVSSYGLYKVRSLSIDNNMELLTTRATLKVKALDEKLLNYFETLQSFAKEIAVSDKSVADKDRVSATLKISRVRRMQLKRILQSKTVLRIQVFWMRSSSLILTRKISNGSGICEYFAIKESGLSASRI